MKRAYGFRISISVPDNVVCGKVGCQIRMNPDDLARLIPFQYADLTV